MAKPKMLDLNTLLQAGIDPKTGLPYKFGGKKCTTKEDIKKVLRIIDEQDAVNRYKWYNLPMNLSSQELERMLYYKSQLAFFYFKDLDEFYFMPYALDGTIDFYGRFNSIHPIPMTCGTDDKKGVAQASLLADVKLNCVYDVKFLEDLTEDDLYNSAVILRDYTNQLSQTSIPRVTLNDVILDMESETLPYLRTALLMGTGVKGVRVNDPDQYDSVLEGANRMNDAALASQPYIPIVGNIDFQELTNGTPGKADDYLLALQSLDNLRLSTYGLDNGGIFEKKAYVNNQQTNMNQAGANVGAVLNDGLLIRQHFCNIVNSIWGLGIWCEISENISQVDVDGDGITYERENEESESVDYGNRNESNV